MTTARSLALRGQWRWCWDIKPGGAANGMIFVKTAKGMDLPLAFSPPLASREEWAATAKIIINAREAMAEREALAARVAELEALLAGHVDQEAAE